MISHIDKEKLKKTLFCCRQIKTQNHNLNDAVALDSSDESQRNCPNIEAAYTKAVWIPEVLCREQR